MTDTDLKAKSEYVVSIADLLRAAEAEGYAIAGVEVWDQTSLKAACEAASEADSPLQVLIGGEMVQSIGYSVFMAMAEHYIDEARVPVSVHLDECPDRDIIYNCIAAGFTSVMFDGADLDYEANVRETAEVVRRAHASNVSVEASLGRMPFYKQDTGDSIRDLDFRGYLTDPEQAMDFAQKTGIDVLAPSVGNVHALYKETVSGMDFALAEKIHQTTRLPLSMHGSTGATAPQIRRAIECGFYKINRGTRFMELYRAVMREGAERYEGFPSAFNILADCGTAMKGDVVEFLTEICGSDGKGGLGR